MGGLTQPPDPAPGFGGAWGHGEVRVEGKEQGGEAKVFSGACPSPPGPAQPWEGAGRVPLPVRKRAAESRSHTWWGEGSPYRLCLAPSTRLGHEGQHSVCPHLALPTVWKLGAITPICCSLG